MYAAWMPSRIGEPWESWEDDRMIEDHSYGCDAFTISLRARRTELEVVERLALLGKHFDASQPKRKIRKVLGT